uniref:Sulfotransferase domain-containing protein n=1 Tax=Stomoxys calcitrans TaxID=35570 RepID=A0A1I8NRQ0_STOCA
MFVYNVLLNALQSASYLSTLSAQRLNNTSKADIDIIFFNRATKVGSESMLELFLALEAYNEFTVDKRGLHQIMWTKMERWVQQEIAKRIVDLNEPSVYISHVNWIDFDDFDLPKPIYVNMVRDPVERVVSWYYYIRGSYRNAVAFNKFPNRKVQSEEWFKKNFNDCVRNGDEECQYMPMEVLQHTKDQKSQVLFFCGNNDNCL